MTLEDRKEPYQALTVINLPFIERVYQPGQQIPVADLVEAGQTDEDIELLVANGALGEVGDELHPSSVVPDPDQPSLNSIVAQARTAVEQLEANGGVVPDEVRALADLDVEALTSADRGVSSDAAS